MNNHSTSPSWPSPAGVTATLDELLSSVEPRSCRPPLTYLRRKPGRGLVAVYGTASDPARIYTVTVQESAIAAQRGSVNGEAGCLPSPLGQMPDPVEVPSLGLAVQRFPKDQHLPHLVTAMAPSEHPHLKDALEAAARTSLRPETSHLLSVDATPVRYKPGDRCVIRYRLQFARAGVDGSSPQVLTRTVIGKLYRDLDQAAAADDLMRRLWAAQSDEPWTARPLGVVAPIPLVLSEDLGSSQDNPPTVVGTQVIRCANDQPYAALRQAARALAELHTSGVADPGSPIRTGANEAAKAAKRANALEHYVPALASRTERVAASLSATLASLPSDVLRPAHGSYKPSQLLFRADSVFVVDFDQFCWADPALDVGYFLAYLRPPGLWYHRARTRSWLDAAAATFLSSYEERLAQRGEDPSTCSQIVGRSHVYEAALLLKIAARRPNRLHSPRPGEVDAVLAEISGLLDAARSVRP